MDLVKWEMLALVLVNGVLVALLLFQQLFWARQVQKLIDKLMSKSFAEYKLVEDKIDTSVKRIKIEQHDEDLGSLQGM
jgi:biopolymer transport protein ExbB/TolQ